MNRKIVFLIIMALVLTGGLVFSGHDFQQAAAAETFERVNFISGVVTASRLNVRQGPSTKFPTVLVLNKGQSVNVLAKIGSWYVIYEPVKGIVGAASASYIKQQGTNGTTVPSQPTNPPAQKPTAANPTPTPMPKPTPRPTPRPTQVPKDGINETPIEGPKTTPAAGISEDEQRTLDLINKERANAGLAPLKFDMELQKVARLKAKDMVEKNYFSHQSPTYGSPFDMMRQYNISFRSAGENIAGNRTIEGAVKAWMESSGHRKNILNANFNYTGIGVVESPRYGKIFVQMFIGR
jgi:uncharacterized YkwD family protein